MLLEKIILEDDETVLAQTRRHWFVLFSKTISLFLAAFAPGILLFVVTNITQFQQVINTIAAYGGQIIFIYAIWVLLIWMALFSVWTNYYLDIMTITNKRIVVVDQLGFFSRSTGSFRLERLQDINVDIHGIIATFLDFGTLEAQTASGSEEEFRVHGLPHPRELRATILRAADGLTRAAASAPHLPDDGV